MKGYARVLQLLDPLRKCAGGEVLLRHVQQLLEAEAVQHGETRRIYRQLLGALLAELGGNEQLRVLAALLESSDDALELAQLAPDLLAQLDPPPPCAESPLERALAELVGGARPSQPAAGEAAAGPSPNEVDLRQELDAHTREIGELERKLDADIGETIRQNQQAGALLEGLLSRLQLAGDMPELIDEPAALALEIEQLLSAYHAIDRRLADTRGSLRQIASETERLHDELSHVRALSLTDELTRLANRRAFLRDLEGEIARAERHGIPFALAMIDLDYFKQVNDAYGHAVGDEVLRVYALRVLSVLRRQDMVARYGGEEFVVLMPNTTLEGAQSALEKVRAQLRKVRLTGVGKELPLPSFSAGATEHRRGDDAETLLRRADVALYRAKQAGRNRTELAQDEQERTNESWQQKLQQTNHH